MAKPAAVLSIIVRAQTAQAQAALLRQDAQMRRTAKTAVSASRTVAAASNNIGNQVASGAKKGAVGMALTGAAAGKLAIDFDKSMRNVNSIAQLPERTFTRLQKRVLKLAGPTAQAPRTLADGLYDLVSSGFDADDSMKILEKSALAATAGLTTTEVSTKAVAAVLNAYRMPASRAGKVSDELFRTVDRGVISFESLAENVGDVLPFSAALGVDLADVGASIATMTKAGISAPETMTRIKAVMVSLLKPGEDLAQAIKKTGFESGEALIRQKGFQGGLETLLKTTDGSKASVAKLFPNIRALGGALALTGQNAAGANKDLAGMRDAAGATDRALSQQSKSVALQWQRMKASASALGIEYGQKLLPKITKVFDVLSDPKLTTQEKFDRITDMLSSTFEKGVRIAASAAPEIASALGTGFVTWWFDANPMMKILGAAAIIRLLGGRGALGATGATIGRYLGGGITAGLATGAGGAGGKAAAGAAGGGMLAGLRGKLLGMAKRGALVGVGVALADKVITDFGQRANERSNDLFKALEAKGDPSQVLGVGIEGIFGKSDQTKNAESVTKALEGIRNKNARITLDQAQQVRHTARFLDLTRQQKREMNRLLDIGVDRYERMSGNQRKASQMSDQFARNLRGLRLRGTGDFDALVKSVTFGSRNILRVGGKNSAKTREAVAHQFNIARQRVQEAMDKKVISVKQGTKRLHELAVKELGLYGITAGRVNVVLAKGANGQMRPNQRGGPITWGAPTGDSVPAVLEKGEYVLNRKAVSKLGVSKLDQINFNSAPRFQGGGMVDPAWDPGAERLNASIAGKVGAWARQYDANMTAGYDPGGGHVSPGHNVTGTATDMVPLLGDWDKLEKGLRLLVSRGIKVLYGSNGIGTPWPNHGRGNHAHIEWGMGGGPAIQVFDGLPRVALEGPPSVALEAGQGALDRIRGAANASIERAVGFSGEGSELGYGFSGDWVQVLEQITKVKGWSAADWKRLVQGESGGDPTARNPSSGAFGLGQFLGGTLEAYRKYGAASTDPVQQIQAMAKYIEDRYGNPTNAYNTWLSRSPHWYSGGGAVGMAAGGPPGGKLRKRMHSVLHRFGSMDKKGKALLNRKQRGKLLRGFLERVKGVGLPTTLNGKIASLTKDAAAFGDYADRAGQLTVDTGEGDPIQGIVNGLSEAEWLEKQLETLFKLRNKLVKAHDIVVRKREAMSAVIEAAQKRLGKVAEHIRAAAKVKRGYESQLEKARKHPKKNAALIKSLKGKIAGIDHDQAFRLRERNALKERILPALGAKRSKLNTARGDTLTALETVQGVGSPMDHLGSLPAVGVLGGDIFKVQMRLRELNAPKPVVTDTASSDIGIEAERELRRLAEQRAAVSEAQFKVLRDTRAIPFMGAFAKGGVALVGEYGPELAHMPSGTRVHSAAETASMLTPDIGVIINGDIVQAPGDQRDPVELVIGDQRFAVAVKQALRPGARRADRGLPGRGGGLR